jgi:hypothetical protein
MAIGDEAWERHAREWAHKNAWRWDGTIEQREQERNRAKMNWQRLGGRVIQQFPAGEQRPPRHGTVVGLHLTGNPSGPRDVQITTIVWDDEKPRETHYTEAELATMALRDPLA